MYRIGVDIGGTKVNIGIFDDENKNLISARKSYIADINNLPLHIKSEIEHLCKDSSVDAKDIISCGVGIPGTVSEDGKKILKVPNISILSEDIAIELERELGVPVSVVQDSRAGAWGEYLCGGGKGSDALVCITLGTGIGTGIVLGGKIYSGALGCAGELGHMPVAENGRPCGCGKRGCMEKYCAGGGLDITAAELFGEGNTASELFAKAKEGDKRATQAIEEAVHILGRTLVSVINLMSPDCILFSGGLSDQEELYLNPLIDYLKTHCYMTDRLPRIEKAALGGDSPMYGAAFVHIKNVK